MNIGIMNMVNTQHLGKYEVRLTGTKKVIRSIFCHRLNIDHLYKID